MRCLLSLATGQKRSIFIQSIFPLLIYLEILSVIMMMSKKLFYFIAILAIAMALSACGKDYSTSGRLTLSITDAPIDDAAAVTVNFTGVELKPKNGPAVLVTFETMKSIDLMGLTGGITDDLLTDYIVESGEYNWLRLVVANDPGNIELVDGTVEPLTIPSGAQTGLKMNRGFTIAVGGVTQFTIDFDLRKSVHLANGQFILRPTLRLVDNLEVGTLTGSVDASLLSATDGCVDEVGGINAVVYVFSGTDVVPADIAGEASDPLTTAIVDAEGNYTVAFLEVGEYTLALTCQADMDDPAKIDTFDFIDSRNAVVIASETTIVPVFE